MKRSHLFVLMAGLLGLALAQWLANDAWFESLERQAQDLRMQTAHYPWRPRTSADLTTWSAPDGACRVVIVAIDAKTWNDFLSADAPGGVGPVRWPFPPSIHVQLVRQLAAWKAGRVGFDIVFDDRPATGNGGWSELATAIEQTGLPTVMATRRAAGTELAPHSALLAPANARPASADLRPDADDVIRHYDLRISGTDSLAAALIAPLPMLPDADNLLTVRGWIDDHATDARVRLVFSGPPATVPRVSFSDVIRGHIPPEVLKRYGASTPEALFGGRTVLVGLTWPGWNDGPAAGGDATGARTPYYGSTLGRASNGEKGANTERMPSVEVHAHAVQMLNQQRPSARFELASVEVNFQILIAACLVMVLAVALVPPVFSLFVLMLVWLGLIFGSGWVFDSQHLVYGTIAPIIGATITFLTGTAASYMAERSEKRFIRQLFGKYVSREVVNTIAKSREAPKLGGERRELTVMFTDLAGFTAWSEKLSPERLLELLNDYLGAMGDVIYQRQGTVDKFIGDAIMAFWNAPVARKDHAARACEAALAMIDRLAELNKGWQAMGLQPLSMRVGINTGEAVVGNAGSGERFDYTAFGDQVNLASRLEGAAKFYGICCIVSASTYKSAGGADRFAARQIDRVRVVGRKQPVDIFELISTTKELDADPKLREFLKTFDAGVAAYFARDWPNAASAFLRAQALRPNDGPTKVFVVRVQRFAQKPPPPNWDGSVELSAK